MSLLLYANALEELYTKLWPLTECQIILRADKNGIEIAPVHLEPIPELSKPHADKGPSEHSVFGQVQKSNQLLLTNPTDLPVILLKDAYGTPLPSWLVMMDYQAVWFVAACSKKPALNSQIRTCSKPPGSLAEVVASAPGNKLGISRC